MENITTKGFDVLGKLDKEEAKKLLKEYSAKYRRLLKNFDSLVIHLKEYKKAGNSRKSSIHARVTNSLKVFEASASEWEFKPTLHKVLGKLETEIRHTAHK